MATKYLLGRLKVRFGCLRRDMYNNLSDFTHVIHACFILHNISEIRNDSISQQEVEATMNYDREFKPPREFGYDVRTSETGGKKVRQTFVEYFENQ